MFSSLTGSERTTLWQVSPTFRKALPSVSFDGAACPEHPAARNTTGTRRKAEAKALWYMTPALVFCAFTVMLMKRLYHAPTRKLRRRYRVYHCRVRDTAARPCSDMRIAFHDVRFK
ncbi:MAG TPA: hypothetical protein VFY39_03735, partial [Gammaproteobacteria bacterium]|nr:hypothetical protein [Gammaproteobacteria bacterium]